MSMMSSSRLAFSVGKRQAYLGHKDVFFNFAGGTYRSMLRCDFKSLYTVTRRNFSQGTYKVKEGGKGIGKEPHSEKTFMQKFLGPKEMPKRGTFQWYREMSLLCTVFAITGTSTMFLVRPAMSEVLGLKGSLKDGPWSYRIGSLVIMTPLYATLLVVVGTVFGRHFYFRHFSVKMFSRFGIPPELMDSTFHETAKNFRKW